MKTIFFKFLFLLGVLIFICGCSSNENSTSDNANLRDLILDNNIGEKWDGVGMPSWLKERYHDFMIHETKWMEESYVGPTLCMIYKFSYKGNLLLALAYNRFGLLGQKFYNESGTICYTDDGRRVKFENIRDSFEKSAILLGTNELGGENTPQVANYELGNIDSLGWLQKVIDKVCEDIREPNQLLYQVACGYAYKDAETYVVLKYEYYDKENLDNGPQEVCNVYTLNGEKKNIENLEIKDLCPQRIIDILAYLQAEV